MNVKFRMPKFGCKMTGSSTMKELLLTTLATTISIVLTFGTAHYIEERQAEQVKHETAIMAVCDIDELIQGLKDEIQLEDSLFKVAMYVATHQELIDSLPMDTLDMTFEYLYDDPTVVKEWTADTKENAFNSGIDARMNLGNNQFYDNVQSCYYERRSLMKVMADAPMFQRPLNKDTYEDFLYELPPTAINYDGFPLPEGRRQIMKQVFAYKSTTLYIKRYFLRRKAYQHAVRKLERLNRENKLLMDITNEEIEKYIRQNSENVSQQAIADLIIGTWQQNKDTIVINENNTIERTFFTEVQISVLTVQESKEILVLTPMVVRAKGQWKLNGDTLTSDYDFSNAEMLSFDFDTSNFPQSALERLKDSLEIKKEMLKEGFLEGFRHQEITKFEEVVSFDKSGNTMVWTSEETTPVGNKQTISIQLYRIPE